MSQNALLKSLFFNTYWLYDKNVFKENEVQGGITAVHTQINNEHRKLNTKLTGRKKNLNN